MARFISDNYISKICDENDIIDYVSQYVRLKRSGRDYMGLCPFHNEKTPSFHVSQDKQLFHCFGCGASGNVVQFVMRAENLDFVDALHVLADRVGITIPENGGSENDASHEKRKRIYAMNKEAARFFYSCLKNPETGATAQQYFKQRNIPWKTITTYGLGYAPEGRDTLLKHLTARTFTEAEITEAGLAVSRDGQTRDKFRGRVMFPIIDVRGNVIGFGGRVMHNNKEINGYTIPKYLNSPETPVFDKGKNLFSLNLAKNTHERDIILCEGYMDVISVYQAGVKNIVATLGTAITEDQVKLMLRYADEILICYDMDEAGTKAALRAIDVIASAGGRSRVIRLKNAKDPDEYINKNGIEKFREAVKNAVPATEFKISIVKRRYDTTTADGKILFIDEAVQALMSVKDAVEVDAYISKISDDTGISREAILSKYREKTSKRSYRRIPSKTEYQRKTAARKRETVKKEQSSGRLIEAEKRLLGLIVKEKKLCRLAAASIGAEDYSTETYRRLAAIIYKTYDEGSAPEPAMILNSFEGQSLEEASAVFYNLEIYDGDEAAVKDLLFTIRLEKLDLKIKNETNPAALSKLFTERAELIAEKNTWEE